VDFWNDKHKEAASYVREIQKQLKALKDRKDRLQEAFIYERSIDQPIYQEQATKLGEEIALKELEASESRLEELDLAGMLDFALFVISNPEKRWEQADLSQKQRLQKVLFPQGLKFGKEGFGTSEPAPIYKLLSASNGQKDMLVALSESNSNTLKAWFVDFGKTIESGVFRYREVA
jgi:hypothetical protein